MIEKNTQSKYPDLTEAIQLFDEILKEGNYDLNRFVNGVTLSIDESESETLGEKMHSFIDLLFVLVKETDNFEEFWKPFAEIKNYEKNDQFVEWIKGYMNSMLKPYKETEFIRKMKKQEFQNVTEYCFQNMILQDAGKERIQESKNWEQYLIVRKVIFSFIDMVIVSNYSLENTIKTMEKLFGLSEEKCEIWWKVIEENEDKLWKIMMMKKYNQIDKKLDFILNELESVDIIR